MSSLFGGGSAPTPPSYSQELSGALQTNLQYAPQIFGAEATYDPLYAGLNDNLLNSILFGGNLPSSYTVPGASTMTTMPGPQPDNRGGRMMPMDSRGISRFGGPRFGNLQPNQPAPQPPGTSYSFPNSGGIIGAAGTAAGMLQRGQVGSQVGSMAQFGPAARSAVAASNPQLARLLGTMMSQGQDQLALGGNLNAPMLRQAQQTVRARQQGMLGGTGTAGDFGEALGISQFGQNLYQQRLANAQAAGQMDNAFYTPQISQLMSSTYNPGSAYSMGVNQLQLSQPRLFSSTLGQINPQTAYTNQYAANLNNYNAQQNNQNALLGAGISGAASILGAFL